MSEASHLEEAIKRKQAVLASYQTALSYYRTRPLFLRISWITWTITLLSLICWYASVDRAAHLAGARDLPMIFNFIVHNAVEVQARDNLPLTTSLIEFGAKDAELIARGEYWRFFAPIFLHANLLHVALNMLNLIFLGTFLERVVGHWRMLLIYLVTGVVSIIASFVFAPQELSIGASGAIFGLVGAYSIFILKHRRALRYNGIPSLAWLVFVIAINLGLGLVIPNIDNYAHLGGLLAGLALGWCFTPFYQYSPTRQFEDRHRLSRRWPLALLTILGTLLLAIMAVYINGITS